jgi:hypothetical protein
LFTILFSHLTTTIVEISICLARMGIKREGAPRSLTGFKKLRDKVEGGMTRAVSRRAKELEKTQGQATQAADDEVVYQNELATYLTIEVSKDTEESEAFIKTLGWNLIRLNEEYKRNLGLMGLNKFNREHRLSLRRGERMLVMSGLSWNTESRSSERDWGATVMAVVLETAVVESYRETVLRTSNGAYDLRREIREYMKSIAMTHFAWHPTTGSHHQEKSWEFPDGFEAPRTTKENGPFNAATMRKNLDQAIPLGGMSRRKKNGLRTQIENLYKNKYLWASRSGASSGTMETLAYHCIQQLWKVSEWLLGGSAEGED